MMIYRTLIASMVFTGAWSLISPCRSQDSKEENDQIARAASDWLEGSGENLRIRIRGQVLDPNGNPPAKFAVQASSEVGFDVHDFETVVDGSKFEFWIPVLRSRQETCCRFVHSAKNSNAQGSAASRKLGVSCAKEFSASGFQ